MDFSNCRFEGERPLYHHDNLNLEAVVIGVGESGIKECHDVTATRCTFEGKYPLWCVEHAKVTDCLFTPGARAAIWYSRNFSMKDCRIEAPKMFREMDGLVVENCEFTDAEETFWGCRDVKVRNCRISGGTYLFMNSRDLEVTDCQIDSKYVFQYCKNLTIRNCTINTRDAFWESSNVTIYDSEISSEFLAWYSRDLHLVRCHISGPQPLCYADGLVLEDCTMDPMSDLAFEYSDVQATIKGHVHSIKNPRTGHIVAGSVGKLIIDDNIKSPGDCKIEF